MTRLSEYLEVVGVLRCSNFAILRISLSVYFSCLDAFNRFNSSDHFARSKISFFFFFSFSTISTSNSFSTNFGRSNRFEKRNAFSPPPPSLLLPSPPASPPPPLFLPRLSFNSPDVDELTTLLGVSVHLGRSPYSLGS